MCEDVYGSREQVVVRGEPEPLVSCIIIFLNEQKYLAEAIESVIAQTYTNWELLLVDDGSTDGSEAISRSYCERFPDKIHYLTHDGRGNLGRSASRNLGLHRARGKFAAFLDGDDWWYPDKLERQIALFGQHPRAIMVCGATNYWHSWQKDVERVDRNVLVGQWDKRDGTTAQLLDQDRLYERGQLIRRLYPLGKGVTPSLSGKMVRREVALALGGFEDSFRGLFDDQVFRAKFYLYGPIFVSRETFDRYRQHDESCCHVARVTGQPNGARRQFLLWLRHYLDMVDFRNPAVRMQLRRKMLRYDHPLIYRMGQSALAWVQRVARRN